MKHAPILSIPCWDRAAGVGRSIARLANVKRPGGFGPIDAMKLRSSLTLFSAASGEQLFEAALVR